MAAEFISTIKSNGMGGWHLELRDTLEEDKDKIKIAYSVEEFAEHLAEMGEEYGGDVEVKWLKDEPILDAHVNEIRQMMMAYEQKMNEEKEANNQVNDGFDPNK